MSSPSGNSECYPNEWNPSIPHLVQKKASRHAERRGQEALHRVRQPTLARFLALRNTPPRIRRRYR